MGFSAQHIERASRKEKKSEMNGGDSVAVEPAKTVNRSPGALDPEMKLNAEDITVRGTCLKPLYTCGMVYTFLYRFYGFDRNTTDIFI